MRLRFAVAVLVLGVIGVWSAPQVALAGGDEPAPPVVDGNTITGTYGYEGRVILEGGYRMSPKLLENVSDIACGDGGEPKLGAGPGGSPECGYHPGVTSATVTVTGRKPWYSISPSFTLKPYVSLDDKTYEYGRAFRLSEASTPKATKLTRGEAKDAYLAAVAPVNEAVTPFLAAVDSWGGSTTAQEQTDAAEPVAAALDEARDALTAIVEGFGRYSSSFRAQIKAVREVGDDLDELPLLKAGASLDAWRTTFHDDLDALTRASVKVRVKLGLRDLTPEP